MDTGRQFERVSLQARRLVHPKSHRLHSADNALHGDASNAGTTSGGKEPAPSE